MHSSLDDADAEVVAGVGSGVGAGEVVLGVHCQ